MQKFNLSSDSKLICVYTEELDGNLSFNRGEKKSVIKNRQKIAHNLGIHLSQIYEGDQIHGNNIVIIGKEKKHNNHFPKTDGLITNLNEIFLMIKVGDCFPVVFFDSIKKVIAVVHVGWRGATQKIFLEALLLMVNKFNCRPENIKVGIGPGIRQCCFIHKDFIQKKLPEWKNYIVKTKKNISVDLPAFVKDKLFLYGIKKKNIKDSKICTVCNNNFYSHYRSQRLGESEGRQAMIIGVRN